MRWYKLHNILFSIYHSAVREGVEPHGVQHCHECPWLCFDQNKSTFTKEGWGL
jgi:hypothetical protein